MFLFDTVNFVPSSLRPCCCHRRW